MTQSHDRRAVLLMPALFIAALALRPEVIGIGPLLATMQQDLGISHAAAGLLSTIVVLCMGLFAPVAYVIARHAGARATIGGSLLLVALAGIARALSGPAVAVILWTVPLGVGTAIAGSLMPLVVRESWPSRPVLGTATYTTGLSLGAAVSAAVAVRLADALGGWRATLLVFSLFALVASVAWVAMSGGYRSSGASATRPRLPVRSRTGWLLVGIFALTELTFYGINAWLPAIYTARGWSRTSAGDLLTVINGVTIPVSILVALKGDRRGSRRSWLIGGAVLQLAGILGVLLAPAGGWAWAALLGAGNGLLFPSVMMMPLDVADSPAEVGAMSALMLCGGFTISATGPFIFGLIRDLTGSFTLAMTVIAVLTGVLLAAFVFTTQEALRRDPRQRPMPLQA